jgi:peptide/nickel transport system ATP-binding protein
MAEGDGVRLLDVRNLKKYFPIKGGFFSNTIGQVKAVDDVSLHVDEGEILSLVGESGCGKTTTSRCVLRAVDPTSGEILFRRSDGEVVDVAKLRERELRPLWRDMQMIFQDPFGSLNPRKNLFDIIGEPLYVNGVRSRQERMDRVAELLGLVGLRPEFMHRYPHAFSGGQRQRVVIARALALSPRLVVADEAVSALDVSVQAQILNLLLELQERLGLSYLFVAHDLSIVKHISHRVAVMYVGKIVETAETGELFARPRHPYTAALLAAVPVPDPDRRAEMVKLEGEVANPANPPSGCYFHPRCPFATDECRNETPALREVSPGHWVACHRAEELELPGIGRRPAQAALGDAASGDGASGRQVGPASPPAGAAAGAWAARTEGSKSPAAGASGDSPEGATK